MDHVTKLQQNDSDKGRFEKLFLNLKSDNDKSLKERNEMNTEKDKCNMNLNQLQQKNNC